MLHIVNKSPEQSNALASCLRFAQDGQAVLLIEDAIYAATSGAAATALPEEVRTRLKLYVLQPDLDARGMAAAVIDGVAAIDYAGFVDLVAAQGPTQSWL
jgi:tRNA 2-thiouridine synthesizing protein B